MGTDDNSKPWDAPDPAQLRITASPALDRGSEDPLAGVGQGFDPTASPDDSVAIDAPPIPRGRRGRAPPPAIIDTRAPTPRVAATMPVPAESAPAAPWQDRQRPSSSSEPTSTSEEPAAPIAMPLAVRTGIGVGLAALCLVVASITIVLFQTGLKAVTGDAEVVQEIPIAPNVPAFRGIGVEGAPGSDREARERTPQINVAPKKSLLPRSASTPTPGTAIRGASTGPAVPPSGAPAVVSVRPQVPDAAPGSPEAPVSATISAPDENQPESLSP